MFIGERLVSARRAAGLSQRALANAVGVSAMAISKYERDHMSPSSQVLLTLAKALNLRSEYFTRPARLSTTDPAFRCRRSLSPNRRRTVIARAQDCLERYFAVESLFGDALSLRIPEELVGSLNSLDEIESRAESLREAWTLGMGPIESVVELLEDKGIKVGLVDADGSFDALTFRVNGNRPVIVVKRGVPGDRQRLNLAHELGHILLGETPGIDPEKAAYRFAGALLVPQETARFELGDARHQLSIAELYLLKHKYGLSMQAWVYRAMDLGIISPTKAQYIFRVFRERGWRTTEPGEQIPEEKPSRMERLIMRALSEGMITESRAAELSGMSLSKFRRREVGRRVGVGGHLDR